MANYIGGLGLVANGNIKPMSIVSMDASGVNLVRQASAAGDLIIGAAGVATDSPPNADVIFGTSTTQYAAIAGEEFQLLWNGDIAQVTLGTGGCKPGDWITSDSGGLGVVASSGNSVLGRAIQGGAAGDQPYVAISVFKLP